MKEEFKKVFIECLEDEDVKNYFHNFLDEYAQKFFNEFENMKKNKGAGMYEKVDCLNEELQVLKEENEKKEQELLEKKKSIEEYKKKYEKIEIAYREYERLSLETKKRLRNIFETNSLFGFIAAGLQWENIEGLWNYIRRRIIEDDNEDVEGLNIIFEVLFEIYNLQREKPLYVLIAPEKGDKFDSDKHIILGTKTDGHIKKIRLKGIISNKGKKVISKAIIEV